MTSETEAVTRTLDTSSHTNNSRLRREPEMDPQEIEISADELTFRSVDERIKEATVPILR